jgi:hypothetical protein
MFFTLNIFFYFLFFGLECVLNFYQFPIFQSVVNLSVEYTPCVSPIATCSKEKENIDE